VQQGKPVSFPQGLEDREVTNAVRVEDEGESECRSLIKRIRIERKRHYRALKRAHFPRVFRYERT
jgi:hypothetical protein